MGKHYLIPSTNFSVQIHMNIIKLAKGLVFFHVNLEDFLVHSSTNGWRHVIESNATMLKMKKTGRRSRSTRCRVTYERQSSKLVIHPTLISTPSFRKNRKLWKKKRLKMKKTNEPKRFVKKFFSEGIFVSTVVFSPIFFCNQPSQYPIRAPKNTTIRPCTLIMLFHLRSWKALHLRSEYEIYVSISY